MTTPNAPDQLATLRAMRDAATDPAQRAAFDAAIAAMEAEAQRADQREATITGGQTGIVQQGNVGGNILAPLFAAETTGNYFADVIHLYGTNPQAPQTDYGAALRAYLEHLYTRHATIDLRGIDDRPMDMLLTDLYVSLSLHEPPPDETRGAWGLRKFVDKARTWISGASEDAHEDENEPADRLLVGGSGGGKPVDWSHALRHPRLAVVGAPGSGKTTLLQFTAVRLAEILARDDNALLADLGLPAEDAPPVPLLLPLREFGAYLDSCSATRTMGANPRLLLDCFASYYRRFDLTLPSDFFSRLCDAGRALVLLDGLDEVTRSEDRIFVSSVVRECVIRYPACRYVVTSRVAAYHGDARIEAGFTICTVSDLSSEQQQRFIHNWSRSLHRLVYNMQGDQLQREAGTYANDLWEALQPNQRVRELATNPLLLTVVAVIFYNKYQLPEDRASLYDECVEVLLRGGRGKADRPSQERARLCIGLNQRREVLATIAYTMHQQGEEGLSVSRSTLLRMLRDIVRQRGGDTTVAETFVDELPVHIGLLDEREPDRYRFSHLSFQEFLAAWHVAETDKWADLLAHYQESWWREVILLCAGHLSSERCWRFLGELLDRGQADGDDGLSSALLLTADAHSELEKFKGQGHLNTRMQQEARRILDLPANAIPARARVRCGTVLDQVGDPRPAVTDLPPDMVPITGGTFIIGSTKAQAHQAGIGFERYYLEQGDKDLAKRARQWPNDEINDQPVSVASFELARYPITNAQYELFMQDGGYEHDAPWWDDAARAWLRRDDKATEGLEWYQKREYKNQPEFWNNARFGIARPNHPVVGISWYEAMAFCRWLTQHTGYNPQGYIYRLPTEAEWEYAARGTARRAFPWGDEEPDDERANFKRLYEGTTAVGCFPQGTTPEGLHEMAGQVLEWTRSVYKSYPYDPADGREDVSDPAAKRFVIRGGSWYEQMFTLHPSIRINLSPANPLNYLGLRPARHLP